MARQLGGGRAVTAASRVSVVIPFLDPPVEFFSQAIESVIAQDYRPAELILVNDGSREEAVTFAKAILGSESFPVRYVEHGGGVNRGSSASRNLGVSAATGEFIAFLDADDVWAPGKLSEQTAYLRARPGLAMVFGQTRYWYSWRQGNASASADFVVRRGVERETAFEAPDFVARFLRGRVIVPSASNSMMRRDAYLACGGFEERFRGMYEDQAFLVKLGLGSSVAGVPKCWDSYRQHSGSMTARAGALGTELVARRQFLEWVREYCAQQDVQDPALWEAINKEAWLAQADSAGSSTRCRRIARKMKQWGLRVEESIVPAVVRQRLWGRDGLFSTQSRSG
jgi:glycosyltransferase involved in cell wall biosynthesis